MAFCSAAFSAAGTSTPPCACKAASSFGQDSAVITRLFSEEQLVALSLLRLPGARDQGADDVVFLFSLGHGLSSLIE